MDHVTETVPSDYVKITKERYLRLLDAELLLSILQENGVDNWEGYSYSLQILELESEQRLI